MPYPIKNSATLQTNSIKNGSFGLGVNQGGYGLTSSTAFWNGKTPNVSGYVLYIGNGASSPTTYVAKNDNDLIALSNVLGYGPNTTIGQTLTNFNGQSNLVICVNMDCPNIVVGDLTLYLDAGFPPSYPKSGVKWQNISGTVAITANLFNGPTFNSDFYGSIVFDGSDDYADSGTVISFPHNSAWSIQFIVKTISFVNTYPGYLIQGNATSSGVLIFYTSDGVVFWKHNNIGYVITTTTFGEVYDIAITYSGSGNVKAYVNGVFVANVGTMASTDSTNSLLLGRGDQFSNHSQYTFLRYSRELSAAEVLQNYYAGLQRFIPTNGLVLWLDGQNTNTRVITPTTAIDMSDNDNNGSLINGITLSRDGSTSFLFDGANDYVDCGNNTNVQSLTQITMSVWVKFSGLDYVGGTGALLGFMSKGNPDTSSPNNGFWFAYDNRSNGSSFTYTCFGNSAGGFAGGGNNFSSKSYTFTNNVWYNITVTVKTAFSSTSGSLYINGVLQGSSVTFNNFSLPNTSNQLYVGRIDGTSGYFFNGNIAQVRIYNTSLSAAQVLTIYTAGRSRYGL